MSALSLLAFRIVTLFFAILLGAQSVWLLFAQLSRPGIHRLPVNATEAAAAVRQRGAAALAASIGAIRGDLWAESAFTYADLLFDKSASSAPADLTQALARARANLGYAVADAPINSDAWLLAAGLAFRYPTGKLDATEMLKMSYYTGPSSQTLIPLRLQLAVHPDGLNDFEIHQFIARDLRFLIGHKQKSAIADAYDAASPAGKRLIEQTIKDIDPSILGSLPTGAPRHALPD